MLQLVGTIIIIWYCYQAYKYTARYDKFASLVGAPKLTLRNRLVVGLLWPRVWWLMGKQ